MTDLIAGYIRHIRAAGYSPVTCKDREDILRRIDDELSMGLEMATTEELADWLAYESWSAQTRATYYQAVAGQAIRGFPGGFFTWACDARSPKLDYNPGLGLNRPRVPRTVPRPLADAEVDLALRELDEQWRTYFALSSYAGMRAGEVTTIRREHITEQDVHIKGKGGKTRVVPTHDEVWRAVQHFPAGRIARMARGGVASSDYIASEAARRLRAVGIIDGSLHRARHWFATTALNNGATLRTVQELLGHASVNSTAIYTLVSDGQRQAAILTLPTFRTPVPA